MQPVRWLLAHSTIVICAGGGGIPFVVEGERRRLGVEAVVDKDRSAALLARELEADLLVIVTDVAGVYLDWGAPSARLIRLVSPDALDRLDFAADSMAPKIEAACDFVKRTGHRAVIGALGDIEQMIAGTAEHFHQTRSDGAGGGLDTEFLLQMIECFARFLTMNPITLVLSTVFLLAGMAAGGLVNIYLGVPFFIIAIIVAMSVRVANVWEKFVILRVGKLQSVKGAGFFMIIPVFDNVVAIIDERIQTTAFNAEQALTKDTVPVNVDAIIFWHVFDAQKAALAITDYRQAIDRVAQTTLRELIGSSLLATLLSDRVAADTHLRDEIAGKTVEWRVSR